MVGYALGVKSATPIPLAVSFDSFEAKRSGLTGGNELAAEDVVLIMRADALSLHPGSVPAVNEITSILNAIERGDPDAADRLWPLVYEELRKLAAAQLARENPGQTLQPTALVHETYLRLTADQDQTFANRRHFFAAAAQAMRRLLVENARSKARIKRGGGRRREYADLDTLHADGPAEEVLALHEALDLFAAHDPVKAKLVELHFFGGLTLAQAAECLNISLSTADRGWRYARAWLYTAMSADDPSEKQDPV